MPINNVENKILPNLPLNIFRSIRHYYLRLSREIENTSEILEDIKTVQSHLLNSSEFSLFALFAKISAVIMKENAK